MDVNNTEIQIFPHLSGEGCLILCQLYSFLPSSFLLPPDLNCKLEIAVVPARREQKAPDQSGPRRTRAASPDRMSDYICQVDCQNICQTECQIECQNICKIESRNICQIKCQIECQNRCQIECQNICQIECQNICQVDCQNNVRENARPNVRLYVR